MTELVGPSEGLAAADYRVRYVARARSNAGLSGAYDRYWNARSAEDQSAAYFEILLLGGSDGYSTVGKKRQWIARALRRLAARIDGFGL